MLDETFMRPANFRSFSWRGAYVMGALASLAYDRDGTTTVAVMDRLGGTILSGLGFHRSGNIPNVNVYKFPRMEVVGIEGTTNQWVDYLLTVRPDPVFQLNGVTVAFPRYFSPYLAAVGSDMARLRNTARPLFMTGHSLGAAIATIVAGEHMATAFPPLALWTFASPLCVSESWARQYRPTHFRLAARGDIVPRLPFNGYQFATMEGLNVFDRQWMAHCGTQIELPGLDNAEIEERLAKRGITNFFARFGQRIDVHYMAAYMEDLWTLLDADSRRDMRWLKDVLVDAEFSTVPEIDNTPPTSAERSAPIQALIAEEQAAIQQYIGPSSTVRVRLFESATPDPTFPTIDQFIESSFDGYNPASVPAGMKVISTDGGTTTTDDGAFEFRPATQLPIPAVVAGIYATIAGPEDADRLLDYVRFSAPQSLLSPKDAVKGRISFELAAVAQ